MPQDTIDVLIFIARPAAGKSEIIRYLKDTPPADRAERFRIGQFDVLDDFPMLWAWFEEDAILEELGYPRLHTTPENVFKDNVLWHLLIRRLSLNYSKMVRDRPDYHATHTAIVEFSRGAPSGGYRAAFDHLSDELLRRAGVMYVEVTFEESMRKNRARFNPDRPDSILEHGLPDHRMEAMYKEDDFESVSAGDSHWLTVRGIRVPYVVFDNHDDVTTGTGEALGERLQARMAALWELWQSRE
jgi:hypothetical protein